MAKSLTDSIDKLADEIETIASLAVKSHGTGKGSFNRLFGDDKDGERFQKKLKKLDSFIGAVTATEAWLGKVTKASDYHRALNAMRRHPGMWATPDEYLRYEKRHIAANERISAIRSKDGGYKQSLINQFGAADAARILQAEQSAAIRDAGLEILKQEENGKEAYKRDKRSKGTQRYEELRERYGGTVNADDMASEMFERETELRKSRAIHQRTINDFRKFPWLKTLVDAGIIQKKELPKITKMLGKASRMPIIGHFAKHPSLAALSAAAFGVQMLHKSDTASARVTNLDVIQRIYGRPDKRFEAAARLAGIGDLSKISQTYGKFAGKYGEEGTDAILRNIGTQLLAQTTPQGRKAVIDAFGLDESEASLAMMYSSEEAMRSAPEYTKVAAKVGLLESQQEYGLRAGSSIAEKMRSVWLGLPATKSIEARIGESPWQRWRRAHGNPGLEAYGEYLKDWFTGSFAEWEAAQQGVHAASLSLDYTDRSVPLGLGGDTITNNGDTNITNNITVNGGAEIKDAVSGATEGSLKAVDRQRKLDYISPGVLQ